MKCKECNIEMPPPKRKVKNATPYCRTCYQRIWQRINRPSDKRVNHSNINDIKEFVNRIEKRNGIASIQEIFVEMISLYNDYGTSYEDRVVDTYPVNKQLEYMWNKLKSIAK